MARSGLAFESFEGSICSFSLWFKDPDLELAYRQARSELKLVTVATKRFLMMTLVAHFSMRLLDLGSAIGGNPNYNLDRDAWIVYSTLLLILAAELASYFCIRLSNFRGILVTVLGLLILLNTNFSSFSDKVYYPFPGVEYALSQHNV
ncbi:MAG: hypothetical protein P4M11_14145 [Candidatus Pacebacteria bacterium]|nr:hypothetical protein [Candidatus Paceibacterota bacterium]